MRPSVKPPKDSAIGHGVAEGASTGNAAADDVVAVRDALVGMHRIGSAILGFGVLFYLIIALSGFVMWLVQRNEPVASRGAFRLTLAPELGLALLGVGATVLVALVATLWTSSAAADQVAKPAAKARRQVQYALTFATGVAGVVVALATGAHLLSPQCNVVGVGGCLGLAVVIAWIAADVATLMSGDKALTNDLTKLDADRLADRLVIAGEYWKNRNECTNWRQPRRPRARALFDLAVMLLICGGGQWLVLAAWGGTSAVRGYLGWFLISLLAMTLIARWFVIHLVSDYVTRPLSSLALPVLSACGFVLFSVVFILHGASSLDQHSRLPLAVAMLLGIATAVAPVLLTAVAIRSGGPWSVARWLPSSRARVLAALERAEKRAVEGARERGGVTPDPVLGWLQRRVTAARRARGSLPA